MKGLDHRAAIITGASSGIGAELARQLAAAGVAVGLTARREDRLDALTQEIRARGGQAFAAAADFTDRPSLRSALDALLSQLGPLDLLVANAGLGLSSIEPFPARDIIRMLEVNLLGAVESIDAVLPGMLERGRGHLAGISSLAAYRGLPGSTGYCASKAGLSSMFESLRVDLVPRGIAVTTVHPGFVLTAMTEAASHPKPFELSPERAAGIILRGIAARRREVNFPWQMAMFMAGVRALPNVVFDALARRQAAPAARGAPRQ